MKGPRAHFEYASETKMLVMLNRLNSKQYGIPLMSQSHKPVYLMRDFWLVK
jgi:hypothetical protein